MTMPSPEIFLVDDPFGWGRCLVGDCGWMGPFELRDTAEARAVWHIFEKHPDVWRSTPGLGPVPRIPRPEGPVT